MSPNIVKWVSNYKNIDYSIVLKFTQFNKFNSKSYQNYNKKSIIIDKLSIFIDNLSITF